jgi:exosortase
LAYGPLLWMFFRQQWEKAHYQYFPFVIGAFAWLLWQRYKDGAARPADLPQRRWIDAALLAISFGLLAAAIVVRSPWGAMASLILLAAYFCRQLGKRREITNLWGIWVLLWLVMPLPFGWDQKLITFLQRVSSRISSFVLEAVGVNHLMEGNALALPDKQLFVDEACSGIISILSVVACAAIYGVYKNRSPLHLVLLAAIGIGWATVINVGRISIIAFVYDQWGVDWSTGASHEILSLVLFMITFLALLSSDVILSVFLEPVAGMWHTVHAADLHYGSWLARAWDALVTLGQPTEPAEIEATSPAAGTAYAAPATAGLQLWRPVLLFVPLAVVQGGLFAYALSVAPLSNPAVQRAVAATNESLPPTIGELTKMDFKAEKRDANNMHGMYSRTYQFKGPDGVTYVTSFDFPFSGGWHELTECYVATGWERRERHVRTAPEEAGAWQYVEADFEKPGEMYGTVMYAEFDQNGVALRPHEGWERPADSFLTKRNLYLEGRKTFQVQVFAAGAVTLTDAQRQQAAQLLAEARQRFHRLITESSPPASEK